MITLDKQAAPLARQTKRYWQRCCWQKVRADWLRTTSQLWKQLPQKRSRPFKAVNGGGQLALNERAGVRLGFEIRVSPQQGPLLAESEEEGRVYSVLGLVDALYAHVSTPNGGLHIRR